MPGKGEGSGKITAKTGPGYTMTNMTFNGVNAFSVDSRRGIMQIYQNQELTGKAQDFDLTGISTFTVTITGSNFTLTVS